MSSGNHVHLDVEEILRETQLAFLLLLEEDEIWAPKSVIADANDYDVGDCNLTISVAEWWAEQKGLA